MADTEDRILSSLTDVVATEHYGPGMVRVITVSDEYVVDARHEVCECPDYEYNLDGAGRCKHIFAALRESGQLPPEPVFGLDEGLDESEGHSQPVATDGGCSCDMCESDGLDCFKSPLLEGDA